MLNNFFKFFYFHIHIFYKPKNSAISSHVRWSECWMIRQCWMIIMLDDKTIVTLFIRSDERHLVVRWLERVLFGYKKQVEATPNGLTTTPPPVSLLLRSSSSQFFFLWALLLEFRCPANSCPTASKKSLPLLRSLAGSLPARSWSYSCSSPSSCHHLFSLYPHFLCTT